MSKEMLFIPIEKNPQQEKREKTLVQAITRAIEIERVEHIPEKFDARARAIERAKIIEKYNSELDEARRVPRELLDKEYVI